MRKMLILALAFFVLTGFKWGSDSDSSKSKKTTGYAKTKATSSYATTAPRASTEAKKMTTDAEIPEVTTVSTASATTAATTTPQAKAQGVKAAAGLLKNLGGDDPQAANAKISSLARVSRALSALKESKAKQATT